MIKTFTQKIEFSWFFLSLLGFVLVLPFSQALVSIFSGIMLGVALLEDTWKSKFKRFNENKVLLFIPGIFMIYLVSFTIFYKSGNSLYDLQKALFFLIMPLAFMLGKPISASQKRLLFYAFATAIFFATIIAFANWIVRQKTSDFEVHKISLISHIRFSFQLILIFWFLIIFVQKSYIVLSGKAKSGLIILAFYFLAFLFFQQSLTGLIAFGASLFFAIFLFIQTQHKYRIILQSILIGTVLFPAIYLLWVIISFYNIEKTDEVTIDKTTSQGNFYLHDFENKAVENGHYTYLYICHEEMREEWNKVAKIKYDDILPDGFPLSATLIRYLTSKGLRKDAEGIKSLSKQDILNIENGIANYIFYNSKYSLYPRIYQTVWEYYMYSNTGDPSYQSFSQRIEFAKAAVTIIKKNFWFGVGAGNWKEEFKNTYIQSNSKLEQSLYASSHNQYLNYMVKFGFTGFILIMFFIVYPVIRTKSYRDPIFMILLVFLFFANFADSNFETHMGSSFFLFFYSLFVTNTNSSYLSISKENSVIL
jgi:hypothetical protein